jgi:hypothetical protein
LEHLGLGWPKAIAADGGTVVIAYRMGGNTVYIRRSTDRGSSWTDLGAAYNGDSRGLAATDFGVHSIWQDGTGFGLELFYRRSTDGGLSWSPEMQASSFDGENSQSPRISANESGNVFLVWNDQKYGGFFGGTILLKRSEDNGASWKSEHIISQFATALFPRVFSKGSVVAVTWDNDDEDLGAIRLRMSFDSGDTWTSIIEVAPVEEMGGMSDIWIQDSTIHMVWGSDKVSNSEIYYKQGHFSISDQPPVVYAESTHVQPDGSIHLIALARDCNILTGSNGVESVALMYSHDGLTFLPLGLSHDTADTYSTDIPSSVTAEGFWSFLRAKDSTGNVTDTDVRYTLPQVLVQPGWNMVSIPMRAVDSSKGALFVNATSPAFSFDGRYARSETLKTGVGYWLKYDAEERVVLNGTPSFNLDVPVSAGWNMIGSVTRPVAVSSIEQIPDSILASGFVEYNVSIGYVPTDTLLPTRGYWVKSVQAGRLLLHAP